MARASSLLNAGLATSSRNTQARHVKRFSEFAQSIHTEPFPASETVLCLWVAHLSRFIRAASIKSYLAAVRSEHTDRGLQWMGASSRITRLLRGVQRSQTNTCGKITRLAMSLKIVRQLSGLLGTSHYHLLLKAVIWSLLVGMFRIGEIVPSSAGSDRLIRLSEFKWGAAGRCYLITLKRSKTDVFAKSVTVEVTSSEAVVAMRAFMVSRASHLASLRLVSAPLFMLQDGAPLLRRHLLDALARLLAAMGIDHSVYRALSFRAGGASSLAACGVPLNDIMRQGRWRSSAVLRYIDPLPVPTGRNPLVSLSHNIIYIHIYIYM